MRNLKSVDFPEKKQITEAVLADLIKPANDTYTFSKLILMAGLLGNEDLYAVAAKAILERLQAEGDDFPQWITKDNTQGARAWMYGRASLATFLMGKDEALPEINDTIASICQRSTSPTKDFTAWALAYRAVSLSKAQYQPALMIEEAKKASMEILWTWVMVIYAAAHQKDSLHYSTAWIEMEKVLAGAKVEDKLTPKNDSQAWALAMLFEAAELMNDSFRIDQLKNPLQSSIAHAETSAQDKILAQLTFQLATARLPHVECGSSTNNMARFVKQENIVSAPSNNGGLQPQ